MALLPQMNSALIVYILRPRDDPLIMISLCKATLLFWPHRKICYSQLFWFPKQLCNLLFWRSLNSWQSTSECIQTRNRTPGCNPWPWERTDLGFFTVILRIMISIIPDQHHDQQKSSSFSTIFYLKIIFGITNNYFQTGMMQIQSFFKSRLTQQ